MVQGALEDNFVFQEFKNLVSKFNIEKIIETGTFYGWSTIKLSELGLPVITIESSVKNYEIAVENFSKVSSTNITPILGNSPEILKNILTEEDNNIILFAGLRLYRSSNKPIIKIGNKIVIILATKLLLMINN